jgi:HTH-type transcriptional regulator / antitoxin HigA
VCVRLSLHRLHLDVYTGIFSPIGSKADASEIIHIVRADLEHPLLLIHAYEEQHFPLAQASGIDVLAYLMEEHGLTQAELPEVGSQGVVSEILRGKRELNVRQIRALSNHFDVSPAVFF